jgi:tRNA pseudouridine32 synthase/23S rRNA pseudouridine746 synthase
LSTNCFIKFKASVENISLPKKFTFPFYYEPHPLALIASKELQEYLENQTEIEHNFGLNSNREELVIGKMFGILVVKNQNNELGYLAAFSGRLAETNYHENFVPPVYDILHKDGVFRTAEKELNKINEEVIALENNLKYLKLKKALSKLHENFVADIITERDRLRTRRNKRRALFKSIKNTLSVKELEAYQNKINQEGINSKFYIDELTQHWENKIEKFNQVISPYQSRIDYLKKYRKEKSAETQHQLFLNFKFLNINKEEKSLLDIFSKIAPPGGAGECAAPKLLQYAFLNDLTPITMAEFWWGAPPKSEIKKHKQFYPSCIGKCEPILSHMLKGIELDDNPLVINQATEKEIEYIYEDDDIIIINKPNELLSVPGKKITDSVYSRIVAKYKSLTGPVIVHRLDMSTSGVMILAKTKPAYKILQQQFINRSIKKRYVALLEGIIKEKKGIIDLPLRVDIYDRPKQLVCYEHGRSALTHWEVIEIKENKTRIYLYPVTGRTHQLRVHCAFTDGLNTPILGDDLYGLKQDRLYLHAETIVFNHPTTNKKMKFSVKPKF